MAPRGARNRFRLNHFIDENTKTNYDIPYSILNDGLVFYPRYYEVTKLEGISDEDKINQILTDEVRRNQYDIVRRDDDNDDQHVTEFVHVYRGTHIVLSIIKYYTDSDGEGEVEHTEYTFKTESDERMFCSLLRDNLKMIKENPDRYYAMKQEYLED